MDQQYIPANKKSIKEKQRWPSTMQQLGANLNLIRNLHVGGGDSFARTKRSVAAAFFASARPMASIEQELLQHTRDRSCAGPVRSTANRTRDVLDAVVQIAQISGYAVDDEVTAGSLGVRLEIGLPAELADLAQLLGSSLSRGQYLSLLNGGIRTTRDLDERASDLEGLVGAQTARVIVQTQKSR